MDQRVAMVSGASGGIGGAIARELGRRGFALSLGIRTPAGGHGVGAASATPADSMIFPYEAREAGAGQAWVEATSARFGRIDVLVNAAGIMRRVAIEDGDLDDLDEMLEVNVKAPLRLIRAALPHLRACGRGRVVNVASLSGKRVRNANVGYQISKFGMVALSHGVRQAAWDDGVRAIALCPSYVRTNMTRGASLPDGGEMTDPEDLAQLVGLIVELPNSASVSELVVNCGYEPMW